MQRRVFTRRRHAETKARRRLRRCVWLGAPATLTMIAIEASAQAGMPAAGASAFAIVALAYTTSVYRLHDLTGEWQFY